MWKINILILINILLVVSCENKDSKKNMKRINSNKLEVELQKDIKFLKTIQNKYKDQAYEVQNDKSLNSSNIRNNRIKILYFNKKLRKNLLFWGIIFKKNEVIKKMINNKIDINKEIHPIWNNIFSAIIASGNLELTRFFIESKKAEIFYYKNNKKFHILNNMLNIDAEISWFPKELVSKYIKIIDYMYKNNLLKLKDLTTNHHFYGSLWYKSLKHGILELYQYFISIGFDINYLNKNKQNALTVAIRYGGVENIFYNGYIKCKKEKNTIKEELTSTYSRQGDYENKLNLIKYLLKSKINVNQIDNKKKTALDYLLKIFNESQGNELYKKNDKDLINLLKKYKAKRACNILNIECEKLECN